MFHSKNVTASIIQDESIVFDNFLPEDQESKQSICAALSDTPIIEDGKPKIIEQFHTQDITEKEKNYYQILS